MRKVLQFIVRILRTGKLHQLNFLKLMLADDTAYVLAVRTGLAAETRRVRGEAHWQTGTIEYLITVKIG